MSSCSVGCHVTLFVRAHLTQPSSAGAIAIAAGNGYTCALLVTNGTACWGNNGNGQLGTGDETNRFTPAAVAGLKTGAIVRSVNIAFTGYV